jgi:hypothetical protein
LTSKVPALQTTIHALKQSAALTMPAAGGQDIAAMDQITVEPLENLPMTDAGAIAMLRQNVAGMQRHPVLHVRLMYAAPSSVFVV